MRKALTFLLALCPMGAVLLMFAPDMFVSARPVTPPIVDDPRATTNGHPNRPARSCGEGGFDWQYSYAGELHCATWLRVPRGATITLHGLRGEWIADHYVVVRPDYIHLSYDEYRSDGGATEKNNLPSVEPEPAT